jgi:ABC-type branched-subunit amino acid transport system substrate-binding protein
MAFSFDNRQARRAFLLAIGASALTLAACQTRAPIRPIGPSQPVEPDEVPESAKHQVALVIPLSGEDGPVGTSITNAAMLALLDSGAKDIRLTTYDSSRIGAAVAGERAIAGGAKLILGPLLSEDVRALAPVARRAKVPLVAFSNDTSVAGNGVYIMGITPGAAIDRVVRHVRGKGAARFGALVPTGLYGQRAAQAMLGSVRATGGRMVGMETFNRSASAGRAAAMSLNARGDYDAVLIADSGGIVSAVAPMVEVGPTLLGTELWANDRTMGKVPRLRGSLYAAAPDARFQQLVTRYRARYGKTPYRIGSLGYDAVLLTVRAARQWPMGRAFPTRVLSERDGFAGVDGIFRFGRDGVVERALEVRQVTATGTAIVAPAATSFGD